MSSTIKQDTLKNKTRLAYYTDHAAAIQAAFLDLKLADILGQLLGRLVPVLGQGADAGSLCTMVLEAILTLQDPETCLNPMGPALQRVPDETPTPAEVTPLN